MRRIEKELAAAVLLLSVVIVVAAALAYLGLVGKARDQAEGAEKITTQEQAFALATQEAKKQGIDLSQYRLASAEGGPRGWWFLFQHERYLEMPGFGGAQSLSFIVRRDGRVITSWGR